LYYFDFGFFFVFVFIKREDCSVALKEIEKLNIFCYTKSIKINKEFNKMYKVTLEINSSIYEHIMFFLENLPKNLVNIQQKIETSTSISKKNSVVKLRKLQGLGKELYHNINTDKYIRDLRDEW
jgi:hypothetical protein